MTVLIIAHRLSTIKNVVIFMYLTKEKLLRRDLQELKADKKSYFSKLISLQEL